MPSQHRLLFPVAEDIAILSMTDIEELALWALDEHGLTSRGWTFGWDRAVRQAGCCRHKSKRITLARPIFEMEENRGEALETILHEIAHALVGPRKGHGAEWKLCAVRIGASPNRCHSLRVPPSFVSSCECGWFETRVRTPSPSRSYSCRYCSSSITWLTQERWIELERAKEQPTFPLTTRIDGERRSR